MFALTRCFWSEESGQDVIEYALLTALIGVAGILTWQILADRIGVVYSQTDANVQSLGASTPDPLPAGS